MNEPKPKKLNHEIIPRETDGETHSLYRIMDDLIGKHHPHLADARIALVWKYGWNEDRDGSMVLGKCQKVSDVQRDLSGYDFTILLNHEVCNRAEFGLARITALVDHELCHAQVTLDENDDVKLDEAGRPVWRMRKHDIEEFREVVARHGIYKQDLESFAEALRDKMEPDLFHPVEGEGEEHDDDNAASEAA